MVLAGVAPIPASSGETRRMRLNRGGNRRLNRALYTIALSQAWHHEPARAYIARKRASGRSCPEIVRCLKHDALPNARIRSREPKADGRGLRLDVAVLSRDIRDFPPSASGTGWCRTAISVRFLEESGAHPDTN
jgi:hypothetical protein